MLCASSSAVLGCLQLDSNRKAADLPTFNEKATWAAQSCCDTDIRQQQRSILRSLIRADSRAQTQLSNARRQMQVLYSSIRVQPPRAGFSRKKRRTEASNRKYLGRPRKTCNSPIRAEQNGSKVCKKSRCEKRVWESSVPSSCLPKLPQERTL